MSDEKKQNENAEQQTRKGIALNTQYIKDVSFENPRAPQGILELKDRPNIDIALDIDVTPVKDDIFEVALKINATAKDKEGKDVLFIVESVYAGIFTLHGLDEKEREPALLIYCPNLLFPFARRVIADLTRDGGFPPLMLDPIDFSILFAQRKAAEAKKDNPETTDTVQ